MPPPDVGSSKVTAWPALMVTCVLPVKLKVAIEIVAADAPDPLVVVGVSVATGAVVAVSVADAATLGEPVVPPQAARVNTRMTTYTIACLRTSGLPSSHVLRPHAYRAAPFYIQGLVLPTAPCYNRPRARRFLTHACGTPIGLRETLTAPYVPDVAVHGGGEGVLRNARAKWMSEMAVGHASYALARRRSNAAT